MSEIAREADATENDRPVWLGMTQQQLDDAYDQAVYAPNRPSVQARRAAANARAKTRMPPPRRLAYGSSEIEQLDFYPAANSGAPVIIYIHGGAWRSGKAANYAFLAEMFTGAGFHCVIPDFINVDAAEGDLEAMAHQVRASVAWLYRNPETLPYDPGAIFVAGHSSGAHLSSCIVTTDWEKEFGLSSDVVKGALLASGMYDLAAVRLSKRSRYVRFTDRSEQELSAQRHIDRLHCPVIVAYGTLETPEFQRQARDFAAALDKAGKPVQLIAGEGFNHFEITETLGNPYGLLGRAVIDVVRNLPATVRS
jgi:arylformamidase